MMMAIYSVQDCSGPCSTEEIKHSNIQLYLHKLGTSNEYFTEIFDLIMCDLLVQVPRCPFIPYANARRGLGLRVDFEAGRRILL